MHVETFKIFCDVIETASFSQAAERNGITQSAVSQQIRALEERYHVALIERGRRNFSITPEGEAFLGAAREIVEVYRDIESRLTLMRDVVAGELPVATVYSIGFHELPPYLTKFREKFPEVELSVHYRRANQVYADVLENRACLGLVAYPLARKGIEVEPVWRDRLVLICPPGHTLSRRKSVSLAALDDQRFISFEPDLPTRKAIDEMLREASVKVREVVEFDNIETVKRGVEIENAVSIVPSEAVQDEVRRGTLCQVIIEGRDMWRPVGVVRRRGKALTPAMREFIALLRGERAAEN
ncbi:MAG TPA: LysR family transcriptional regulator [Verrucomicrobiales bacterium]|nr:LysR family transcriptional regulator [Verrucomicrobiae bacterium]MCP5555718.1 LysR family transcriptional regulator [Akkermansiaceae bacterium]HRX56537.1 LysR family transcriptional regulator [Verrucomicrobiales bacterium]